MRFYQLGGLVWIFIGAILVIGSVKLNWGTIHKPGSGFMPLLTGSLLVIFGICLMINNIRMRSAKEESGNVTIREFWRRGFWSILISFGYLLFLNILGFNLANFLLIFSLLKLLRVPKWLTPLLISFSSAIVSYFIFEVLLKVNFPRGIFGIG